MYLIYFVYWISSDVCLIISSILSINAYYNCVFYILWFPFSNLEILFYTIVKRLRYFNILWCIFQNPHLLMFIFIYPVCIIYVPVLTNIVWCIFDLVKYIRLSSVICSISYDVYFKRLIVIYILYLVKYILDLVLLILYSLEICSIPCDVCFII